MDSYLLYPDRSIAGESSYPSFQDIYKDLNLNILLKTMSQGDAFIMEQIRSVMMVPVRESSVIRYRYEIVKELYKDRELADGLYQLGHRGVELAEGYRKELEQNRNKSSARAGAIIAALNFVTESLQILKEIRREITADAHEICAEGLVEFRKRILKYPIQEFEELHKRILFYTTGGEGIFSIRLSGGLKLSGSRMCDCRNYKAANLKGTSRKLLKLYYKVVKKDTILIEDETLEKDIHTFLELHMHRIIDFYKPLIENLIRFWLEFGREIAFYKGINNLQYRMKELSLPLSYGDVCEERGKKEIEDLYELSLALYVQVLPVTNSLRNQGKYLTIITGANQGGKSTFLRSFGIAQIMLQCGMPVPAKKFVSSLYSRIHTHFTRKEDAMLSRGRLEEELKRMSSIVSQLSRDSLLLLNESFASTTEKEGSQIAYNVIMPLYDKKIEVMMVTHLHEFARNIYDRQLPGTEFLVAERLENGKRTFHMIPGKPHYSSYGTDLFQYMIEDCKS